MTSAGHRIIRTLDWYRSRFGAGAEPTIEEHRAEMERSARLLPVRRGTVVTPVDAGGVPGEWVTARGAGDGTSVLYLHGGGYTNGSPRTHRSLLSRISAASGARILAPAYRLAPEHPFPAAADDALAVYAWMLGSGIHSGSMAIAGDSAGGGLAMATLVAARDAGLPMPAAAVLLSPWTDLACTGESLVTRAADDPWIIPDQMGPAVGAYLGDADPRNPLASPLYADVTGMPPTLIQVGGAEVLFDDSRRLAERIRKAGGEVILDVWADQIHVFQAFGPFVPKARPAVVAIGEFIRQHAGVRSS
ncbi:MAG TPA: alpha/beta hydrolase [Acidimicrobiia bacterium]|nr:alpha/beta hydrolase [Acidimicrobiia bacterium]